MAATPSRVARAKVAAVVKADSKRGNTGNPSLAILLIRASGWAKRAWASNLHATIPQALALALDRDRKTVKADQ
jgi:hypothetical protein